MFKNLFSKLFDDNAKIINSYQIIVDRINDLESDCQKLSDGELQSQTAVFKKRLSQGESLDDILPEAYAVAREAAVRVLNMRMFDVQLIAAIAFHRGQVAEQKTGEGKTLSAVPALYLNGLTGEGCHLVTTNDYLARRDAGWMGQVFTFLGLSTGVIYSGEGDQPGVLLDFTYDDESQYDERLKHLRPVPRREAYQADITYGTNNEFGFDYLRDNMVHSLEELVQRNHHFAIVDEVDSILIDEARTPLIISAPDTDPTDKYFKFADLAASLSPDTDYEIDEKVKSATLTEHGITKIEKKLGIDNLYEKDFDTIHHIENALKAKTHYLPDRDYVNRDGEIIIVDEFTGRLMYGRRWSEGLHQAVEAKEGVKIQQESKTLATISFQNYFRMYVKLAGMTGTAETEKEEFERIYGLRVIVIPTNRPVARIDHGDLVYKTVRAKYAALADEIAKLHDKGQPVLVGTTSIEKNQLVSQFLKRKKIPHNVLNAKNHLKEAMIIADAGKVGAVTIATNIAGRGVDIVLGGAPPDEHKFKNKNDYEKEKSKWQEQHDQVLSLGGLAVIGTERHESRRIDNQLRGRSGRQGDPGMSRFYVSLEDDIMRIFGGEQISRLMTTFKLPENVPLEHAMVSRAIEQAQVKVEGFHFDSRKHVVEYDDVMNKQREIIYKRRKKILENAQQEESLSQIYDNIKADIENIVDIYYSAQALKSEIDHAKIVREYAEIVPFDTSSQHRLQLVIQKLDSPDKVKSHLIEVFDKIYQKRETDLGKDTIVQLETYVSLRTIDKLWMEHLDNVDDLREGIGLRGYAQKDPLVEYKNEAFDMFERLLANIDYEISRQIMRVSLIQRPIRRQTVEDHPEANNPDGSKKISAMPNKKMTKTSDGKKAKLGRNDPCWCGAIDPKTGKVYKYKKCGLINAPHHKG